MNKRDLVECGAAELGGSRSAAEKAVKAVLDSILDGVERDGSVSIAGFGTFERKERAARTGRNPRTGESLEIPASITVGFRPAAALKRGGARIRSSQHVHKMIRFLAENYTNPISVADVAAAASISTGYAMGAFKKSLGQSINGYLNQLRLHHAKVALIDRGEKVITVALDSGFGSLSRFYEVFIADTGKTPQQFRREHQRQLRD